MNIKNKLRSVLENRNCFYVFIVLMSVLVFCSIYGTKILNPCYVDWLMTGGDLSQHYLGWMSFRNSEWMFPIGMTKELSYPFSTSVIFTDSIPLFAVFFKLFRMFMPENFQYFGFWGIACFILQGLLSTKILEEYLESKVQIFFASILFVISPVMIFRMYGHTALAGHWILLLAIYTLIKDFSFIKQTALWTLIGFFSSSVHIYFIAMTGFIAAGVCLKLILQKKLFLKSVFPLIGFMIASSFTVGVLGGFSNKTAAAGAGGLGYYSMNLNAFFNPQGWSCFVRDLSNGPGQYEGFAFLGLGTLFLLMFDIFQISLTFDFKSKIPLKEILPYVLVFLAEFIFAISNVITFFGITILTIPLPKIIYKCWSVFRSTGRFSWICVYLIMIYSIKILSKISRKKLVTSFIIFAVLLQIVDLHKIIREKHSYFSEIKVYNHPLLNNLILKKIASDSGMQHFFIDSDIPQDDLYAFACIALGHKKTLNRFYLAHGRVDMFNDEFSKQLTDLREDNVYVFKKADYVKAKQYGLHCYLLCDYVMGLSNKLENFEEFIE